MTHPSLGAIQDLAAWLGDDAECRAITILHSTDPSSAAIEMANTFDVRIIENRSDASIDVDRVVDAGADVLIFADSSDATITHALIALLTGRDASGVMAPGGDDSAWMRECADIRDALRGMRPDLGDREALLDRHATSEIVWMTRALLHASTRNVPVLINGSAAVAAALVAARISHASRDHWRIADRTTHPAIEAAVERLAIPAVLDIDLQDDPLLAAVLTVPLMWVATNSTASR